MAIEIERKFLVIKDNLPKLTGGQHFVQGYFCGSTPDEPNIRFRIIDDEVIITIKKGEKGSIKRYEWEFKQKLPEEEIGELKSLAIRKPIEKDRYKIPYADLVWELDVYRGENEGLVTADVELPSVDYNISFPDWIKQKSEIGNDPKYFNINLGEHPYPEFRDGES